MRNQIEIYLVSESQLQDCLRSFNPGADSGASSGSTLFGLQLSTLDEAGKVRIQSMPAHGALFANSSPLDQIGKVVRVGARQALAMHLTTSQAADVIKRFHSVAQVILANKGHISAEEKLIIHTLELAVQQNLHALIFSDFSFRGYE